MDLRMVYLNWSRNKDFKKLICINTLFIALLSSCAGPNPTDSSHRNPSSSEITTPYKEPSEQSNHLAKTDLSSLTEISLQALQNSAETSYFYNLSFEPIAPANIQPTNEVYNLSGPNYHQITIEKVVLSPIKLRQMQKPPQKHSKSFLMRMIHR